MALTIGIDARAASEVQAGRGRYVRELLLALEAHATSVDDVQFVLYARRQWGDLDPTRFTWRLHRLPDPLWHAAAAVDASRRTDVFLSTNSYLTAWMCRIPTAVVVFDLVAFLFPEEARSRAALIEKATIGLAIRRAAALACISEATRADLIERFPASRPKTRVIPLAADPGFRTSERNPSNGEVTSGRFVLSVGTLEPRKNLERLISAWQTLSPATRAGRSLVLVGPRGWKEAGILSAARGEDILVTGHINDEELRNLYRNCDCFVYPSLYEGFGLPVLEAMTAGAPVVTSNVSSLPEVAGDAALLVDPLNTSAIAAAIAKILDDPNLAADLRELGATRAKEFSWERTASETLALLRSIAR